MASVSCIIKFDYILPIVSTLLIISMIPSVYLLTKTPKQARQNSRRYAFFTTILFITIIFIYYVLQLIGDLQYCHDQPKWIILAGIQTIFYLIQGVLILYILFFKLHFVFKPTRFRLSQWTIRSYIGYVTFGSTIFIICETMIYLYYFKLLPISDGAIIIFFYGILLVGVVYITSVVWLNGLFIKKIIQVYKTSKDEEIKSVITKTALLCFISTAMFLPFVSLYFAYYATAPESEMVQFMLCLLEIVHIYINYLSVLLSYKEMNPWYIKMCGCCDITCRSFWRYVVKMEQQSDLDIAVECVNGSKHPSLPKAPAPTDLVDVASASVPN